MSFVLGTLKNDSLCIKNPYSEVNIICDVCNQCIYDQFPDIN